MKYINLQREAFDEGALLKSLYDKNRGAIASFTGIVRAANKNSENDVASLMIEHHPIMTKMALEKLGDEGMERYNLASVIIIHRYGLLHSSAPIVFVAAASAHRKEAIEAVQFIMDRLKTDVPLWKKEIFADGRSQWVDQKASDIKSAALYDV